jgi:hypothetical protein
MILDQIHSIMCIVYSLIAHLPGSPADFGKLIVDETDKWAKVILAAGIKPPSASPSR